jgi:5,10-methenyltetrahydromethanopterin hydrogenase
MRNHSHETERAVEKLHELEHTADVGESPKTPLILFGEVSVVASVVVAAIVALSLLAYWLAS